MCDRPDSARFVATGMVGRDRSDGGDSELGVTFVVTGSDIPVADSAL